MPDRLPRIYVLAALTLAIGCAPPHRLSASCKIAPSRTTWTATPIAGRIEGEVHDLAAKGPIGNIGIRLVDLDRHQRTDGQGKFRFDSVPEGRHILVAEGSGYQGRGDTLVLQPGSGMRGMLGLNTRRDVRMGCPIYRE
jgi:hypothetical protein